MSEYQYYEFLAIDRTLDQAAQKKLRSISSRATITATSFTNYYEWGDFGGDPRKLMERWFDLHLYLANWGSRRLMFRLPKRCLNRKDLSPFLGTVEDAVDVSTAGDHVIVSINFDELELQGSWEDGTDRLATLVPLRSDLMAEDLRLFYLVWLVGVEHELAEDDAIEPLPGIGPLTSALKSFAEFFIIDPDLVKAAAEPERPARKTSAPTEPRRTAGALLKRAQQIAEARDRASDKRREAKQRQGCCLISKCLQPRKVGKVRSRIIWRISACATAASGPLSSGWTSFAFNAGPSRCLAVKLTCAFDEDVCSIKNRGGGRPSEYHGARRRRYRPRHNGWGDRTKLA